MIVKVFVLICAIGVCAAAEKSCPPDASGDYPKCVCDHFDFIFKDDDCVKVDRDVCPPPAIKIKDKQGCTCPDPTDFFDDYYWFCRTKLYLPTPRPTVITTTTPYVPRCPAYHTGIYPDCVRVPCGRDQPDRYQPDCVYVTFKPTAYPTARPCPSGEIGVYPHCQLPCPPHTARKGFNTTCEPIPCTKGRGWVGEYMPDCVYTPFCPDEFPGHYPYCNRYALNVTSTTTRPTTSTTRQPTTTRSSTTSRTTPSIRTTTTPYTRTTTPYTRTTTPFFRTTTPKPEKCDCCSCCESVSADVQKILKIFETLYGEEVINGIVGGSGYKVKKPYVSRFAEELPYVG